MLEAFVQSGPSAPVAGLPVMSELLRRCADLDEEEADMLRSLATAKPQVRLWMQRVGAVHGGSCL